MNAAAANSNQEVYENIKQELKDWHKLLKEYQIPDTKKALFHTALTFLMYGSVWVLQYWLLANDYSFGGYWLSAFSMV